MADSNVQRSKRYLVKHGYLVAVVEKFNQHVGPHGIRQDLFGFIDLLGIKGKRTIAVQTTSRAEVGRHITKIHDSPHFETVAGAWLIIVHGWYKLPTGKWDVKEVTVPWPVVQPS